MAHPALERILALSSREEELEDTVAYLTRNLAPAVKSGDAVLICFPHEQETDFGTMAGKAVINCGGKPVFWGEDPRWKELLRLSFLWKATAIIAPPLIILGLTKLAAYKKVPLYLTHAVMAGYPCLNWFIDGVERGLDCKTMGAFGPGITSLLSGFSCGCGRGIHIRDDRYLVKILDNEGRALPDGSLGRIAIAHREDPDALYPTRNFARLLTQPCPCGNPSAKLVDLDVEHNSDFFMLELAADLLYWNSVLDCSVERTEQGIRLEIVCFPGEKMPKLPGCAKLLVRSWDPERDCPLTLDPKWTAP